MSDHDTVELAKKLRYDLTAAQGKLSELIRALGELDLPEQTPDRCPVVGCGYRPAMNLPTLAEHAHAVHGGLPPTCWNLSEGL